jgi:hypothetical protein
MNKNIRDWIIIILYTYFIINQIVCSSYIIHQSYDINKIMKNITEIEICKNDNINRLDNGNLYNNTLAILISGTSIIGFFIMLIINKFINKKYNIYPNNNYNNITEQTEQTNENTGLIIKNIIKKETYELAINILFIFSIIVFIVCNGVEFILQLNNISDICLHEIDKYINNFYVVYKLMLTIAFFSSYSLFVIIPLFI